MQKKLNNAHTQFVLENDKIKNIRVKSFFNKKTNWAGRFFFG